MTRGERRVEGAGGPKGAIREGVWAAARTIKANPDAPQRLARQLALEQGKTVFVAVPRLASPAPFLALEPGRLEAAGVTPRETSTIQGAARRGRPVRPDEMPGIDLVLCGSVAVTRDGAGVGKGGGYSDLEYALARELGLVTAATPIVTLVHPLQILDAAASIPAPPPAPGRHLLGRPAAREACRHPAPGRPTDRSGAGVNGPGRVSRAGRR